MKFMLALLTIILGPLSGAAFNDLSSNHQHAAAINYMQSNKIVEGYPDGSFKPENTITRVAFLKMLFTAGSVQNDLCERVWAGSDIEKNAWYAPYVQTGICRQIVQGYPDGSFKPGQNITVVEGAKIISKVYKLTPTTATSTPWFAIYMQALSDKNAIPTSITALDSPLSRGQVAEILYRLEENRTTLQSQSYSDGTLHAAAPHNDEPINTPETTILPTHSILLKLINTERAKKGLPNVAMNDTLNAIGQKYANTMATQKHFSHTGRDGSTIQTRLKSGGYTWSYYGENLGRGHFNAADVFKKWMDSPPHKANILNEHFTEIGFGQAAARADDTGYSTGFYWTLVFGTPCEADWCK